MGGGYFVSAYVIGGWDSTPREMKTHLSVVAERDCLEEDLVSVFSDYSMAFFWLGHCGCAGWPVFGFVDDLVYDLDGDS